MSIFRIHMLAIPSLLLVSAIGAGAQPLPLRSTPAQQVDALNEVFGSRRNARPVHAKGQVLEGVFTPSPAAASISKAPHLQKAPVPITIRFSNFSGDPDVSDTDDMASPRGLAVKFHLPDRSETDLVAHSFNGFPATTADGFRDFLLAMAASGPSAAKPTPLDHYASAHPAANAFLNAAKPNPASFSSLPYFGVNTFKFTNAEGAVIHGRYQFVPVDGQHYLSAHQSATMSKDYLFEALRRQISSGPVTMKLLLQIADRADRLDDPTVAWPETRRVVELGTLTALQLVADNAASQRALLYLPSDLPDGIGVADPMITARTKAYAVSFDRRQE